MQKLKSVLSFANRGLILDAGCGDGRVSKVLAQRGFDVVGCDRSVWQARSSKIIVAIPAVAHGLVYDKILLRSPISRFVLKRLGYLDHIEEGHFHVRMITPESARLQLEALGMTIDSFRNVSFLSTYLETMGNLLSILGFRGRNPLDQVIALDLKIAKYLPLALGSSWLIILHRKSELDK